METPDLKIRGTLTVFAVGVSLVVGDLIQRTAVAGAARLLPSRRHRILAAWQQGLARLMLGLARFPGGARFDDVPRIPGRSGVLVLMNHQSLLDIPLVVRALAPGYPRIITRARYARGKPLISHMVRLYQYPTVDPGATARKQLAQLAEVGGSADVPLVIYPEGTRTRTGDVGRFKKAGLRALLSSRRWEVWIVVSDGHWQSGRLADFLENVSTIRARTAVVGPFESPEPGDDLDGFIGDMAARMRDALEGLRGDAA